MAKHSVVLSRRAAPLAPTSVAGGTAGAASCLAAAARAPWGPMYPRRRASPRCLPISSHLRRRPGAGMCGAAGRVPLPGPLWEGREPPSAHSRLFLVGRLHSLPSPPRPRPRPRSRPRPRQGRSGQRRWGGEGAPCASALAPAGDSPRGRARAMLGTAAAASSGSERSSPPGPAPAGEGQGGEGRAGGRAGRGGERAPAAAAAAAAVFIPAAQHASGHGASQMACPALGLEALQPLQPEPPPEPAFSEAQKWIEVGACSWQGLR